MEQSDSPMQSVLSRLRKEIGNDFLKIEIKVGDLDVSADLLKQLTGYEPDDDVALQREFIKQPVRFVRYGKLWAECKSKLSEVERDFSRFKKSKWREVQEKLRNRQKNDKRAKAPTKDDIEAEIEYRYSDEMEKFEKRIARWKRNVDIFEVVKDAFKQKKEMLVSQGFLLNSLIDHEHLEVQKRKSF